MKALMIGACLAVLGAPALAQPYDQTDPYYDQGQTQPPPQPPGYGQYQSPYDQGYGDEDNNGYGENQADQGYGAYQPPPAPPPGQPGFQNYLGAPQDQYGGPGDEDQDYGQPQPQYDYQDGYGRYQPPQYGYQGGYAQQPQYQPYGGAAGATYTGRTGQSWRNDQGQYCVYREMTWQGQDGRPAYRWVPSCR